MHDIKDCNEVPMMVKVKLECDDEDVVSPQELQAGYSYLLDGSVADIGLLVKEENDFVMKTENELDEVTIKQELDIGPTVVQPETTLCSFPPLTLASPSDPRPSTGAADDAAPASSCLVLAHPARAPRTEVEDVNCGRDFGVPSDASFVLVTTRIGDSYQREQAYDRSDCQSVSVGTREGTQCSYCIKSQTENYRADATKAKSDAHASRKQDECRYCKHSAMKKIHLTKHTNAKCMHLGEKPHQSKMFEYSFQTDNLKIRACTRTGSILYKCELCEYWASNIGNLKRHMCIHTGENAYKCESCEYNTSDLGCLKRHMRTHAGEEPYKCDHCGYGASEIGYLKRHMRIHTGEKPYKCEQCAYSTSRISNLKGHMSTHAGDKSYKCEICEYSTPRLANLKKHVHTHTGEKPYKCEKCHYSTSEMGNLKRHMRIHTGEDPYKCEHCRYSTPDLTCLKRHVRTHTGERPYQCEQCKYSAARLSYLKAHMFAHTGEKPYQCEQCEYSASRRSILKRHMRTHTGENFV